MACGEGMVREVRLDIGEEKKGILEWESCLRKGRAKEPRTADP